MLSEFFGIAFPHSLHGSRNHGFDVAPQHVSTAKNAREELLHVRDGFCRVCLCVLRTAVGSSVSARPPGQVEHALG